MPEKLIYEGESPKTQSIEAVKSLLAFVGRAADPLPGFVEMDGGVRLTLSSKRDGYYTTTGTSCSCPARTYHPDQSCKHMKALQAATTVNATKAQARAYQARQRERRGQRIASHPEESMIQKAGFRPMAEEAV